MAGGHATARLDDHACRRHPRCRTRQSRRAGARAPAPAGSLPREMESVGFEEEPQDLLGAVAQSAQQDSRRQLAAPVDAHEDAVLGIELEIQPRAAVWNHAGGEQQLARGVGLALVVLEEHSRRAMQLRHDDALGAVDDEGAGLGDKRDLPHVHLLLLDVLDGLRSSRPPPSRRSPGAGAHAGARHRSGRAGGIRARRTAALPSA